MIFIKKLSTKGTLCTHVGSVYVYKWVCMYKNMPDIYLSIYLSFFSFLFLLINNFNYRIMNDK